MSIAGFFIIAPNWIKLGCPSTKEQINKPWDIRTMEYYRNVTHSKKKKGMTY